MPIKTLLALSMLSATALIAAQSAESEAAAADSPGLGADVIDAGRTIEPEILRRTIGELSSDKYHQPGDEMDDSWNFDGMVEDARLAFYCGLTIAQADEMPSWNPGDEFEAARLAALAARP